MPALQNLPDLTYRVATAVLVPVLVPAGNGNYRKYHQACSPPCCQRMHQAHSNSDTSASAVVTGTVQQADQQQAQAEAQHPAVQQQKAE
jgi:hypothetical protein